MIDRSILARCCTPEEPGVSVTVPATDLVSWLIDVFEGAPNRDALIDTWAHSDICDDPSLRQRYGLQSAAQGILTRALDGQVGTDGEGPVLVWRVHDGDKAWRVPRRAFRGFSNGHDLEMTWSAGYLWRFDTGDEFRALADEKLPLLTTAFEAETFKMAVTKLSAPTVAEEFASGLFRRQTAQLNERDDLIHRVRIGDLTPDQAEAEAERLGAGSLAPRADPAQFDPMSRADWTYLMVLAWIAWRDADHVRQWMADYREQNWHWRPWNERVAASDGSGARHEAGWVLAQQEPPSGLALKLYAARVQPDLEQSGGGVVEAAHADLWARLRAGDLDGTAVPAGEAAARNIKPAEWGRLTVCYSGSPSQREYLCWQHQPLGVAFYGLLFGRDDILREWPSSAASAPPAPTAHIAQPAGGLEPPARRNRSATKYLLSDDVANVAAARVRAGGGDPKSERELRSELRKMFRELNWAIDDKSLDAIRRGGGFSAKKDW